MAPVATVAKAKEIVKDLKYSLDSDIYIVMEAGEYYISEEISFDETDSGFGDNKIIYTGNTNGGTVINGGVSIENYSVENQILTADVELNDARQLYVNDMPAKMSESGQIEDASLYNAVYDDSGALVSADGIVVATDGLHEDFASETSAELVYYNEWKKCSFPVTEIITLENNQTALVLGGAYSYLPSSTVMALTGYKLYLENCLCYVDEAGEFAFDTVNKKIIYYTNSGETINKIFVPKSEGLINICGSTDEKVRNLVFENITFENGAWSYPTGQGLFMGQEDRYYTAKGQNADRNGDLIAGQIKLNWCENIEFKNNTVKNIGSAAFSLNEAALNCKISGNKIYNTAAGGVILGNDDHFSGTPESEFCVGNTVSNNTITDISLQYSTAPAISVYFASDSVITHNTVKNTPYSGICLGWGWGAKVESAKNNEISYNRIENVMTKLRDGAHIYTNGYMENVKIFGNYMIKSSEPTSGNIGNYGGIYLDNGSCNIEAYNNVVEECSRWLCVPDETVGENGAITFYDNYSDTQNYSADSPYITVEAANSNTSAEAEKIKQESGAF